MCSSSTTTAVRSAEYADAWLEHAAGTNVLPADASAVLADVRSRASDELCALSFPGRKVEAWRRCDLSLLSAARLVKPAPVDAAVTNLISETCDESSECARLVLVDGVCDMARSDLSKLPEGISVGSLLGVAPGSEAEAAVHAALGAPLPEAAGDPRTALGAYTFAAVNQAGLSDVAYVHVSPGVSVDVPVQVLCISSGAPTAEGGDSSAAPPARPEVLAASHPSLVVSVGAGSSVRVMQQFVGRGDYWTNSVTRVNLDDNAALQHSYIQEQSPSAVHIDSLQVDIGAEATYENALLQSGARIGRVNLIVGLNDNGASSDLRGLALATDNQISDVHSSVLHAVPDCTSSQEQRNAVAGRARVVFRGGVKVPVGADNTTANQLCRSLLLSDDARVDMQPTLEIDTDEVVCTHGATVSDLDDEMIFYLQARGLSRLQARSLLLEGWARDALSMVPSEGAKQRAAAKAAQLAPENRRGVVRKDRMQSI